MGTSSVLLVCLHGSAKSLVAAEHFPRLAPLRGVNVDAVSAGTESDVEVPSKVIQGLIAEGINVRVRRPQRGTLTDVANAARVCRGCSMSARNRCSLEVASRA